MVKSGTILLIDDDPDILIAGKMLLKRQFDSVHMCDQPEEIPRLLEQGKYDVIVLDMNFSPGESNGDQGRAWLKKILNIDPSAVVVMITAHGDINLAVEAMKLGASDFVTKPWQNDKLISTLSSAMSVKKTLKQTTSHKSTRSSSIGSNLGLTQQPLILGHSEKIQDLLAMVKQTAATDANILILGENGTGKELIAQTLHQQSQRSDQVFISVDLGSMSESIFESELFGHKKGAFTGAQQDRVGRFEAADGGTIFLDELGNLPLHLQAKLLTVLEQRRVTPLGANAPVNIDVRIIAATNATPSYLRNEDNFRQDLLFRLNTIELTVPSLRERSEDIPLLLQHYARFYERKYIRIEKIFSSKAMSELSNYAWPGNVRALRHAVERAVILCQTPCYEIDDFALSTLGDGATLQDDGGAEHGGIALESYDLKDMEYTLIVKALEKHKNNISHAAKELGITRAALYRRIEKHGISTV